MRTKKTAAKMTHHRPQTLSPTIEGIVLKVTTVCSLKMYPLVKHKLQFRRYPLEYLLEFRFSLLFLLRLKLPESFLTMEGS